MSNLFSSNNIKRIFSFFLIIMLLPLHNSISADVDTTPPVFDKLVIGTDDGDVVGTTAYLDYGESLYFDLYLAEADSTSTEDGVVRFSVGDTTGLGSSAIFPGFPQLVFRNMYIFISSSDTSGPISIESINFADGAGNLITGVDLSFTGITEVVYLGKEPTITLIGDPVVNVYQGTTYTDQGATYDDNEDGSGPVVGVGTVDTNTLGTYYISYDFTDSDGHDAQQVVRTVNVIPDDEKPVITLNGASYIVVPIFGSYEDQGAYFTDNIDGTGPVIGVGTVDTNTFGIYPITYDYTDSFGNVADTVTRYINVDDNIPPIVTILGPNPLYVEYGDEYVEHGAECFDNYDGVLPVEIDSYSSTALGEEEVYYYCEDNQGNSSEDLFDYFRTVFIVDTTPPTITLLGTGTVDHEMGTPYVDEGALYDDIHDGTGTIVGSGNVDVNTVGMYEINYNYTDISGNTGTGVSRTVRVVDTTAPENLVISYPSESQIINDNTPTISGTGDAGDSIEVISGEYTYTSVVDGSGNWSVDITDALSDSNNVIHVTETDPNLNVSDVVEINFVVSTSVDTDGDGVPDSVEISEGTSPTNSGSYLDTDNDGITDFIDINDDGDDLDDWVENAAPNEGDANNDGLSDSIQGDVSSKISEVTGDYVSLDATSGDSSCSAVGFNILSESELPNQDEENDFPVGLNDFTLNCGNTGATMDVKIYYDKTYDTSNWVYKKYNTSTDTYMDMSSVVSYSTENVGGVAVSVVSYSITDGGIYDEDGVANGVIIDPSGPSVNPSPIGVCGEGLGSWLEDGKKININKKKLKKRIKFRFLKKRYNKLNNIEDIDENDDIDEFDELEEDDIDDEEIDFDLKYLSYNEFISLITNKYYQCYNKDGDEKFIPKGIKKSIDKLITKLDNVEDDALRNGIIYISYSRLEKMKNKTENLKLINVINYLHMKLAIEFFK